MRVRVRATPPAATGMKELEGPAPRALARRAPLPVLAASRAHPSASAKTDASLGLVASRVSHYTLGHSSARPPSRARPLSPPQFFKETLDKVLPFADFVFGNESEAEAFASTNGMPGASIDAVALAIAALPKANAARARVAIITQGPKATVVAEGGVVRHIEVAPVDKIVDVNGAGDAFVGGFLAATAAGKDVETACRVGNWAAGEVIQFSGCTFDKARKCPLM